LRIDSDTSPTYVERVNRAIDHIVRHLDQPLKLEVVARAAGFSPYHFHRVFRGLMGKRLQQFVKRLRLERALDWLYRTWLPESGYVPADQPAFEAWIGRPFAHGMQHFELHVQVPVESA
jgi:AraC-like DNA-binding protein